MNVMDELRKQLADGSKAADDMVASRRRAVKQPAVVAYQQRRINSAEYEELVGEPYAATMKEAYEAEREDSKKRMAMRVKDGLLTRSDYKNIVGEEYPEEEV